MTRVYRSSALLISVGILLGSFPLSALAAGIGTTYSKMFVPRISINRSSKDNGGSLSYTGAEYATHRPYKVDFDLLQASDQSHELEMPMVLNNDISDESKDAYYILASDPTLRSRRRRRRQVEPTQQQVISASSTDFQRFNLCLPYLRTNPMCRQMFLGLTNTNNPMHTVVQNVHAGHHHHPSALTVQSSASPTAFYIPQTFPSSSISSLSSSGSVPVVAGGAISRNDLAILNYYQQQQFPPQQQQQQQQQQPVPFQQLGVFQGPLPVQRQRPQYDNIHTKYPYPYPPTLDVAPPIQAVVPESGNAGGDNAVTTDLPSDVSQTTLLPEDGQGAPVDQQEQQDPAGNYPDSPIIQQQKQQQQPPQQPEGNVPTTTYNPVLVSSSPLPMEPSTSVPPPASPEQSSPQGGGELPDSPNNFQDPSIFQQQPPHVVPVEQVSHQHHVEHLAMQKRLREKEDEVRQLKSQLEQANLQVVSYEQESGMVKDQFMRSEEANIKLRDRVLQLENTNQHLQEQNGQLQQVTAEQRQQINGLKTSLKESKDQIEEQNQAAPLFSEESQKHRKEIEDFLVRIRKLGEENDTCKKQVKLYQLKVSYIMEQQRQQQQQQQQQQKVQPQKKKQPTSPIGPQQQQLQPVQQQKPEVAADILTVHVDDDELDPELSRMDAEIAALQKSADEVAAAIQKLPASENIASAPVDAAPTPTPDVVLKKENEFPGEAVQVDPQQTKHKQQQSEEKIVATAEDVARAESASRNFSSGVPTWEQPAGF